MSRTQINHSLDHSAPPDRRGFYHPGSEEEIQALVSEARQTGRQLRVVGAGRSLPEAVYPDAFLEGDPMLCMTLSLDRMQALTFSDDAMEVTVQTGCKIAYDPRDMTGSSTPENNLVWKLDQRGWALPILAGGNIQTVGGYLVSGSDGGSLQHAMGDAVVGLRIIDGRGRLHDLRAGDELFDAAGVSLGLLGVVTAVTFRCVPRFDLVGQEVGISADLAGVGFVPGRESELADFLRDAEYSRVMWYPQPGLEHAVVWYAQQMTAASSVAARNADGGVRRAPYVEIPKILGRLEPMQAAAGLFLAAHGQWPDWLFRVTGRSRPTEAAARGLQRVWRRYLKGPAYRAMLGNDADHLQTFRDTWWQGLSMDSQVDERLLPTGFTEIWVPMSRSDEALRLLREHFEEGGHDAAGNFVTELYGGKRSRFWLSPAYGEDHLRINVFWFKGNKGSATDHYKQYWDLLEPLCYRLHWTKALPPSEDVGADWFRSRYPRFDDFMQVREDFDPDQLFVTKYWREHLEIPRSSPAATPVPGPPPRPDRAVAPRPFPMPFQLTPQYASLAGRASHVFDNTVVVGAPIAEVYEVVTQPLDGPQWITMFRGADWLTEPFGEEGSAIIETFAFMSSQLRVIEAQPPERCISSVDACSLPIGQEMTSEWRLREVDGGTEVHWQVYYTPGAAVKPLHPMLRPFFKWLFRSSLQHLPAYLESRGERPSRPV